MSLFRARNIIITTAIITCGIGIAISQNDKLSCSLSPNCYDMSEIKCNSEVISVCTDKNGNPINGKINKYYNNGKLGMTISLKNGMHHGKTQMYHKNGKVAKLITFENGIPNGYFADYYSNGQLQKFGNNVNGQILGESKKYYEDGNIKAESNISAIAEVNNRKLLTGNEKKYYKDGTLKQETILERGNGQFKMYHPNGLLSCQGEYLNGMKNGTYKDYYDDGKLRAVYNMVEGKINGKSTSYYDDGQTILMIASNKDGVRHGEVKAFARDGKLKEIAVYDNGIYVRHTFISNSQETKILNN